MDWNAFFKSVNTNLHPELQPGEKPKWYDVRYWQIGEWGSVASITGVALWLYDQKKKKKTK